MNEDPRAAEANPPPAPSIPIFRCVYLSDEGRVGLCKVSRRRQVAGQLLAAVVAVILQERLLPPQCRMHLQAPEGRRRGMAKLHDEQTGMARLYARNTSSHPSAACTCRHLQVGGKAERGYKVIIIVIVWSRYYSRNASPRPSAACTCCSGAMTEVENCSE